MSTATAAPGLDFEHPILELESRRRALEQIAERTPEQEEELFFEFGEEDIRTMPTPSVTAE